MIITEAASVIVHLYTIFLAPFQGLGLLNFGPSLRLVISGIGRLGQGWVGS